MIVNREDVRVVEELRAKITRSLKRHVAAGAIELGLFRIIEAARAVPRNAAEQERIIMILSAQEVLILGQLNGNTDLVTSGAKLRALVQRFEESLFVEVRLGLHQRLVDELEHAVRTEREGIMDWFVDGVVSVATRAVDVIDRMASGAGDARL